MCSCRWAHTRWDVTRNPKYSPRTPVCLDLSRAAYIWEWWASGTTGMLKNMSDVFWGRHTAVEIIFQSAQLFRGCLHISCSLSTSTLSRMRTQPHTRKRQIHVASPMSCLTCINWYSPQNKNKLLLPVLQLAGKAKILFCPPSVCSNNWGTCFYEAKKTLLDSNVGNCWEENVPNSFWLIIN